MTHKQMRDQVVQWLGLQEITAYDETALVESLLYQGTIDLLSRTRCTARCVQLRVTANQDTYTLDHQILALVDVEDGARPRARRNDSNGPSFTLIRSDVLQVKPTPDANGTVQVWAVMRPQQMTQDGDSPGSENFGAIPDEYHDAIVTYALWKASDYADDQTAQEGERYRIIYEGQQGNAGRLAQIRSLINKRGTAKAPRAKVTLSATTAHEAWVG